MQSIVLTVHLILAVLLIGVVLLQRSEGGGLGMGSGGGGGGVMTGRQAANALTRGTWLIAGAFIVTSIALTVIAARGAGEGSVLDRINDTSGEGQTAPTTPGTLPAVPTYTPPPGAGQPITPPSSAPAAETPAETPAAAPAPTPAGTTPAVTTPVDATPAGTSTTGPISPPAASSPAASDPADISPQGSAPGAGLGSTTTPAPAN